MPLLAKSRRVIAVTTAPVDPTTEAILELARSLDLPLLLETWGEAGEVVSLAGRCGAHVAPYFSPFSLNLRLMAR